MSFAETQFTFQVERPDFIERNRTQVVELKVFRNGALVAPSSGTFSLFDSNNDAVVDAVAVSVVGNVAQSTILAATLPETLDLNDGWREEWSLVLDGVTYPARRDASLVLRTLHIAITLQDLERRHNDLRDLLPDTDPFAQGYIEEAFTVIIGRIITRGNRPYLILEPWAIREAHILLTLSYAFTDMQTTIGEGDYRQMALDRKKEFEEAWAMINFKYDFDQDGADDRDDERRSAEPVVFLCNPPAWGR